LSKSPPQTQSGVENGIETDVCGFIVKLQPGAYEKREGASTVLKFHQVLFPAIPSNFCWQAHMESPPPGILFMIFMTSSYWGSKWRLDLFFMQDPELGLDLSSGKSHTINVHIKCQGGCTSFNHHKARGCPTFPPADLSLTSA